MRWQRPNDLRSSMTQLLFNAALSPSGTQAHKQSADLARSCADDERCASSSRGDDMGAAPPNSKVVMELSGRLESVQDLGLRPVCTRTHPCSLTEDSKGSSSDKQQIIDSNN